MQVTEEQKIKWAYEALCKFNIINPMDCAIEDHPKWNLICEVAKDPEQDWNQPPGELCKVAKLPELQLYITPRSEHMFAARGRN